MRTPFRPPRRGTGFSSHQAHADCARPEQALRIALQVDGPAQLRQLLFNIDQSSRQGGSPMCARGPLRQNAFPLQLQCLPRPFALCLFCPGWRSGVCGLHCGGLLFLDGFALPAFGHAGILRRPHPHVSFYLPRCRYSFDSLFPLKKPFACRRNKKRCSQEAHR
jgi:hypothetical protein